VRNNLHRTFLMSRECFTHWMSGHGGTIVNMLADIWGACPEWAIQVLQGEVCGI